jgi:23S rRNA pseudouridine1911/1915/1917 synthase
MKTTGTLPDIEILFEDNHLLAVNKPKGVLSQEDYTGDPDLLTLCKEYLKKEYNKPGNVFLGLLHRLDKPVGGVMLFAKTSKAASRISEQIRKRTIKKTYLAVVEGSAPENGYLTHYLLKNSEANTVKSVKKGTRDAKEAQLTFQKIDSSDGLSLLKISLITGRAHQIRVQLSEHGFPIYGDHKYGSKNREAIALHAFELECTHPTLKEELKFQAFPEKTFPWNKMRIENRL